MQSSGGQLLISEGDKLRINYVHNHACMYLAVILEFMALVRPKH